MNWVKVFKYVEKLGISYLIVQSIALLYIQHQYFYLLNDLVLKLAVNFISFVILYFGMKLLVLRIKEVYNETR